MSPLDKAARISGGLARKAELEDWERAFVAMLGGSKRPITKDRRLSVEQVVRELRQEGVREPIPWSVFAAVGMNGRAVLSTLDRPQQIQAVREIGDVAGFVGLVF